MTTTDAVIVAPGQGETYIVLGVPFTCIVTAAQTDGKYSVFETVVPPGNGTPPHTHTDEEVGFYVLDGVLEVLNEHQVYIAKTGDFVYIPRGARHGCFNPTGKNTRVLTIMTPSGVEDFFADAARLPKNGKMADIAPMIGEVVSRHDVSLLPSGQAGQLLAGPRLPALRPTQRWCVLGEEITCLTHPTLNCDSFSLFHRVSQPENGAPLHIHTNETEAFYILEGAFDIQIGDRTETLSAGAFVHFPRGVAHAYQNARTAPSRALVLAIPGGLEHFFAEISQVDPADSDCLRKVSVIADRHGIQLSV